MEYNSLMTKYTQTNKELLKGMIIAVSNILAVPIIITLLVSIVVGIYLAQQNSIWLYIMVGMWVFMLLIYVITIIKSYHLQKKVSKGSAEVAVTEKVIIFRMGDVRSDVPYTFIKSATMSFGFLVIKLKGGGIISVPLAKLNAKERRSLMKNLGLETSDADI